MLIILDPMLFVGDDVSLVLERLDYTNQILARLTRDAGARIVTAAGGTPYWSRLYQEFVRPLVRRLKGDAKSAVDALVSHGRNGQHLDAPTGHVGLYGARQLFGYQLLSRDWLEIMEVTLGACAIGDARTCIITARVLGRNVADRSVDGVELFETTRWRVYVHAHGAPPRKMNCLSSVRHIDVEWTIRMDSRLPDAQADSARCPYCPPAEWWKRDTCVWRAVRSKPCWVDGHGNGWARPRTPGGYHWDLFVESPLLVDRFGLDQLNITQFGAPQAEGSAGSLHHVPAAKRPHLRDADPSFSCP